MLVMSATFFTQNPASRSSARDPWVGATGLTLMGTGIVHVVFGVLIAGEPLQLLVAGGVAGAAPSNPVLESWFWYMVAGVLLLLAGHLVHQFGRATGRIPGMVIPYLLLLGGSVALYPVSGLWLFFVAAGVAAVAWRRGRSARPSATKSGDTERRSDAAT